MRARYPFSLLFSVLSVVWSGAAAHASFDLRKVVAAGEKAPQEGTFIRFEPVGINQNRVILFNAVVKHEGESHGIYLSQGSSLTRLVAVGDQTPVGGTFAELSHVGLNSRGHVAFLGSVNGKVPKAVFFRSAAALKKVVAVREEVPSIGVLWELTDVMLNDNDTIAFVGRSEQGGVAKALLLASANGVPEKVLALGDPSPVGGRFMQFINPSLNGREEIVFEGTIHGGRISSGIFVVSRSGLRKVVAVGDPCPIGGIFKDLALPIINEHSDVLFWAALEGAKAPDGLFVSAKGTIEKVVARGDPTPGGGRLSFIDLSYSFNRSKAVAFQAEVTGAETAVAIFLASGGTLTAIVRTGDPAPGGGRFVAMSTPKIGPDGTVVFAGEVQGGQASSALFLALPVGK